MECQHQFSDRNQFDEQKVIKPTAQEKKDERSKDQGDHRGDHNVQSTCVLSVNWWGASIRINQASSLMGKMIQYFS